MQLLSKTTFAIISASTQGILTFRNNSTICFSFCDTRHSLQFSETAITTGSKTHAI